MSVLGKLGFDSHHKIERFGVLFTLLVVGLLTLLVFGTITQAGNDNAAFSATSLYTKEFVTSRSDAKGTVEGLYRSSDGKSVMCLLKFADEAKVSLDAENYNIYMTAADVKGNPSLISYKPAGSIYMFGSTKYMGIYLYNDAGFKSQILDLTIRCNSELNNAKDPESVKVKEGQDASFAKYDQFQVLINPGATDCEVAKALDDEVLDIGTFYTSTVCVKTEEELKANCDKAVDEMRVSLNSIKEYRDRLGTLTMSGGSLYVVVPDDPILIAGDEIVADEDDKGKKTGTYTYKPKTVTSGGLDFQYRDASITDGYFKLVTDSTSHGVWLSDLRSQKPDQFSTTMNWYLNDGSIWKGMNEENNSIMNTGLSGSDKDVININTTILNLEDSWMTYWQQKQTYERELLPMFLDLELDIESVRNNYSVNNTEKVITIY